MNSDNRLSISRRHDLDALRAFAMLLGIALHAALSFTPLPWPVQDENQSPMFGLFMSLVHGFRMPLFFVMSGFFTAMLWRKRGLKALLQHRFKRIFLPLLLGLATIIPLTNVIMIWAIYSGANAAVQEAPSDFANADLWTLIRFGQHEELARREFSQDEINQLHRESGSSPLAYAALFEDPETVQTLLNLGADPSLKSRDGNTALHSAAFLGRSEVLKVLLNAGADPTILNAQRQRPMESARVDWGTTQFIAGMIQVPIEQTSVEAGRQEVLALLESPALTENQANAPPVATVASGQFQLGQFLQTLMGMHLFHHLWFLWFLCWLVVAFAVYAMLADRIGWKGIHGPWILSPLRYLWLIPITMIPQWEMGRAFPTFGPDTSTGLIPYPHVLLYYGVFFAFGALYFDSDDETGRVGKYWWISIPVAIFMVFPVGLVFAFGSSEFSPQLGETATRLISASLQVTYAWLLTFGLMGVFRRFVNAENPTIRYLSDSSYWLYLAHLPLIFVAQILVRDWSAPALVKFILINVVVTAILLLSYDKLVRYSWLGRLLNGPRTRPVRVAAGPTDAQIGVESA
ncbi:acyltransferase family protein [Thalassoglobus sp. JC818]|uniref:acyltransferase family protein n=1 Tax=Thalassoglobus sp. JC818 TaxID=3232136 RepID=UPI0034587BB1